MLSQKIQKKCKIYAFCTLNRFARKNLLLWEYKQAESSITLSWSSIINLSCRLHTHTHFFIGFIANDCKDGMKRKDMCHAVLIWLLIKHEEEWECSAINFIVQALRRNMKTTKPEFWWMEKVFHKRKKIRKKNLLVTWFQGYKMREIYHIFRRIAVWTFSCVDIF